MANEKINLNPVPVPAATVPFAPAVSASSGHFTEAQAAVGNETVAMHFPRKVIVTLPGFKQVHYHPGIRQVPVDIAGDPWLHRNGVKPYVPATPAESFVRTAGAFTASPVATSHSDGSARIAAGNDVEAAKAARLEGDKAAQSAVDAAKATGKAKSLKAKK